MTPWTNALQSTVHGIHQARILEVGGHSFTKLCSFSSSTPDILLVEESKLSEYKAKHPSYEL